jgi:branched-chain amino acid transport system substrate-binding protein
MMGPFTGPVASIGDDQLHWAEFFVTQWNAMHKLKLSIVQGDTQLNPAIASTVAQSFASNSSIVGVIGPAGSQEVTAVAPILKKAGLAFASGSATNVALTNGSLRGYFFRDVPNDGVQGPTDASYMMTKLGVTKGSSVMIVNDQESYSTGLATIVSAALKKAGVNVDNESVSQKNTDFSSLIAKITSSTKVVFVPFQLASEAQLFAQQLKAQGKSAIVFGSDGTFDSSKFNASGNYVSFFAPDVTTLPADASVVSAYHKQFPGGTSPFGAPNYVLAQAYAEAATSACASGKGTLTRAALRAALAKVKLSSTILGQPLSFTANGDVAGAKFHIFKIENGKYVTVA